MSRLIDLTGKKFGKLTVIKRAENNKNHQTMWLCKCDCGNEKIILGNNLKNNTTKSCGCLRKNFNHIIHGKRHTRIYNIWRNMRKRCQKEYDNHYKYYGARGIKVCEEWDESFQSFYEWAMKNGYTDELTIDRINVNGNYEPSNCRWVDIKTQNNNKRSVKLISYNGMNKTISEWADYVGLPHGTLYLRLHRSHWSLEKALSTPKKCR